MPATMSWPEAVGQIAGQRTKAETCVALIKRYGDDAQIARGQLTYADAKADFDAVIAGLITALLSWRSSVSCCCHAGIERAARRPYSAGSTFYGS